MQGQGCKNAVQLIAGILFRFGVQNQNDLPFTTVCGRGVRARAPWLLGIFTHPVGADSMHNIAERVQRNEEIEFIHITKGRFLPFFCCFAVTAWCVRPPVTVGIFCTFLCRKRSNLILRQIECQCNRGIGCTNRFIITKGVNLIPSGSTYVLPPEVDICSMIVFYLDLTILKMGLDPPGPRDPRTSLPKKVR